jgi:hypothetical protein
MSAAAPLETAGRLLSTHQTAILVAAHKQAEMPSYSCYVPIHVGRAGREGFGFTGDDTGENISGKNPYYSELTGLYWAWKNLGCEWLGLVHYRRHFSVKGWLYRKRHKPMECVITDDELRPLLAGNDVIVPKKRKYYVESIASHYKNTMQDGENHLSAIRSIIALKHHDYTDAYEWVLKQTSAHMFNMFIMRKPLADQYCFWLFDILYELEALIDTDNYNEFDRRYIGRVSEILLNVWLVKNQYPYKEIGYIDLWRVNWPKKIALFLAAKFLRKKYQKSM